MSEVCTSTAVNSGTKMTDCSNNAKSNTSPSVLILKNHPEFTAQLSITPPPVHKTIKKPLPPDLRVKKVNSCAVLLGRKLRRNLRSTFNKLRLATF